MEVTTDAPIRALAGALQHVACWEDMRELGDDFYQHAQKLLVDLESNGWRLTQS